MIGLTRKTKMNGKTKTNFEELYKSQIAFQEMITGENLPCDCISNFSYHVQAMVEEMGEVMKADKRWKTHRNERYVPEEKLDELADVFITAMNLAIYSGFSAQDVFEAIQIKILDNNRRWQEKPAV